MKILARCKGAEWSHTFFSQLLTQDVKSNPYIILIHRECAELIAMGNTHRTVAGLVVAA